MITLSLLKFLENNGLGEIDKSLFFQKLTLDKVGLYISNIGDAGDRTQRTSQSYEIYARGSNDVDGYKRIQKAMEFLADSYSVCELPAVPPITTENYKNVTILKPSTISNIGLDANNRIIYSFTGTILY